MKLYSIGLTWAIVIGLAVMTVIVLAASGAQAQDQRALRLPPQVHCWPMPNGEAQTIVCANGYWHTTMPDGTVHEGNGMLDPNATIRGSTFGIKPDGNASGIVTTPTQPTAPAPGQWFYYGAPAP